MAKSQILNHPPAPNELELSLFGPGKGECIVVHLGNGDWMVVDSCLGDSGEKPIALQYFEQLKVDVATSVKLTVATHWHDDHIRGMAQVIAEASAARFACSAALQNEEFFTLVSAAARTTLVEHTSGVAEFADILDVLEARSTAKNARGPHSWASEGMVLYRSDTTPAVEVHALSPSAHTITDTKGELAKMIPAIGGQVLRFPRTSPNKSSVAILVKLSGLHLLLGADLEIGADDHRGWRAVLKSMTRPPVKAGTYKVAHHGSPNADHPGIWSALLEESPIAIIAPYAGGKTPRPSADDIKRIKTRTNRIYSTVWPLGFSPRRRPGVDGIMAKRARIRRAMKARAGHIRVRAPLAGNLKDVTVALFDGAARP